LLASSVLAAAVAGPALLAIPQASAGVIDNICNGAAQFNLAPPLTLAQHPITATLSNATLSGCANPAYRNAIITFNSASGNSLCLVLNLAGNGDLTWGNGQVSTYIFTISTNPLTGSIGLSATVGSGPFAGDTIEDVPVILTVSGTCLTGGITSLTLDLSGAVFFHL